MSAQYQRFLAINVSLGGHSGGASAVPAAAPVLLSKGIDVEAMVAQHPGVVYYMNVLEICVGCGRMFLQLIFEMCAQSVTKVGPKALGPGATPPTLHPTPPTPHGP